MGKTVKKHCVKAGIAEYDLKNAPNSRITLKDNFQIFLEMRKHRRPFTNHLLEKQCAIKTLGIHIRLVIFYHQLSAAIQNYHTRLNLSIIFKQNSQVFFQPFFTRRSASKTPHPKENRIHPFLALLSVDNCTNIPYNAAVFVGFP
jgi:hypothetical protein